jgi:hypothetical protein
VKILEGRIASLDPSMIGDFALVDARSDADFAMERTHRMLKAVRWGSVALAGSSLLFRPS